jgi:hypothetical protein
MNDQITVIPQDEDATAAWRAADAFATEMNKVAAGDHLEVTDFASYVVGKLTMEAQVNLLFQIIGSGVDLENDKPNQHGKLLAMEIAEVMGPDYMQGFYRLVVLATRLA